MNLYRRYNKYCRKPRRKSTWKIGDGISRREIKVSNNARNRKHCVSLVRRKHPRANGATLQSRGRGKCYAEYRMRGRNRNRGWISTYVKPSKRKSTYNARYCANARKYYAVARRYYNYYRRYMAVYYRYRRNRRYRRYAYRYLRSARVYLRYYRRYMAYYNRYKKYCRGKPKSKRITYNKRYCNVAIRYYRIAINNRYHYVRNMIFYRTLRQRKYLIWARRQNNIYRKYLRYYMKYRNYCRGNRALRNIHRWGARRIAAAKRSANRWRSNYLRKKRARRSRKRKSSYNAKYCRYAKKYLAAARRYYAYYRRYYGYYRRYIRYRNRRYCRKSRVFTS